MDNWVEYRRYNEDALLIEEYNPTAVVSYDEQQADLGVTLQDHEGVVRLTTYYAQTGNGQAQGYPATEEIKRGALGQPVKLREYEYHKHEVWEGEGEEAVLDITVFIVNKQIDYQSDTGDFDPVEVTFTPEYHPESTQLSRLTTHLPPVPPDKNGVGTYPQQDTRVTEYDRQGHVTAEIDAAGVTTGYQYHQETGGAV